MFSCVFLCFSCRVVFLCLSSFNVFLTFAFSRCDSGLGVCVVVWATVERLPDLGICLLEELDISLYGRHWPLLPCLLSFLCREKE